MIFIILNAIERKTTIKIIYLAEFVFAKCINHQRLENMYIEWSFWNLRQINGIESDVKKQKKTTTTTTKKQVPVYATVGSLTGFFGVCIEQQLDPLLFDLLRLPCFYDQCRKNQGSPRRLVFHSMLSPPLMDLNFIYHKSPILRIIRDIGDLHILYGRCRSSKSRLKRFSSLRYNEWWRHSVFVRC